MAVSFSHKKKNKLNARINIITRDNFTTTIELPILKLQGPINFFFVFFYRRVETAGEDSGPLSMFFRSLLPSFSAQTRSGPRVEVRLEQPVEGAEGVPRPLRDTELVRGVENLMVAMRELLNTLSYRGQPEEAGGEEGEDGREENHAEDDWEEEWD